MVNINDVAKEAGVSKSTVSSVLSGKRPVGKEVDRKVREAAKKLNYRPNYFAQNLVTKEAKIIGLNIKGEETRLNQFHLSVLNGVLEVCCEEGYRVLVNPVHIEKNNEGDFPSSDPVDGKILLDPLEDDLRIANELGKKIPTVLIGRPPEKYKDKISYVDNDNNAISFQLTEHLLELGHRNILFLNAKEGMTVSKDRELGYSAALKEFGYMVNPEYIAYKPDSKSSIEYGYDYTIEMLPKQKEISAIIVDSEQVARGVYNAIYELGIKDISVVTYSYDSQSRFSPSLTSTNLNAQQLGIEAAKMLIKKCISKEHKIENIIVPSNLIVRDSTRAYNHIK